MKKIIQTNLGIKEFTNYIIILYITTIIISFTSLYLSSYFFIFDLLSHFQLQYFIGLVLFLIIIIALKKYKHIFGIIIYLGYLLTFYIFPINLSLKDNKPDIFYINMNYRNSNIESIYNEINKHNPQTVAVVEINQNMYNLLKNKYGEALVYHQEEALSCAIFSYKTGIDNKVIKDIYPTCYSKIDDYAIYLIHPLPPLNTNYRNLQMKFFDHIKKTIKSSKQNQNFLLIGDFNTTYYSAIFRKHFKQYFHEHYYSRNNFSPIMIPIDHCLSNQMIQVNLGIKLSSDHRPLLIQYNTHRINPFF